MSLSKPLPRNSGEILNTSLSRRGHNERLPQNRMAWCQDGYGKSLVHDGLDVNCKTRPLLPFILCCQKWPRTSAPHSGKSADGHPHPSRQKKILTFFPREVP